MEDEHTALAPAKGDRLLHTQYQKQHLGLQDKHLRGFFFFFLDKLRLYPRSSLKVDNLHTDAFPVS